MKSTFNLIDESWIPCILLKGDGSLEPFGLRDTLIRAHEIREIYSDSPLTVAAIHRLLLAIVHDVFGPPRSPDRAAWVALWEARQWDAQKLNDYFAKWHAHFYLFHDQYPFYQVTRFPPEATIKTDKKGNPRPGKPIANLARELTSGSNTTLFDHHIDAWPESISLAEAALRLVTTQAFALGGGQSGIPGNNFRHAVCVKGALFLVQGKNLFETLLLNMMEYPSRRGTRLQDSECDRPMWRMDDPFEKNRPKPLGYLDFLTWPSRRIQLVDPVETEQGLAVSKVYLTQGLWTDESVLDPLKNYFSSKKGQPFSYGFDRDKALWRDSVALFELQADVDRRHVPENFYLLSDLVRSGVLGREQKLRYMAFGLATGDGGAGDVALWRHERMPLPLDYLTGEDAVVRLRDALQLAEAVGQRLEQARDWLIWLCWEKPDEEREFSKWRQAKDYTKRKREDSFRAYQHKLPVATHYWWRLDDPFKATMEGLAGEQFEDTFLKWRDTLREAARNAFREVMAKLAPTPRHLKAIAKAQGELDFGLNIVLKVDKGRHDEKEPTH
jgi:CRISPR system Cascade subunit CasA